MSTNILRTGLALRGNLGKLNTSNSYTQDELRKLEGKLLSARVIGVDQSNTSANGNITIQFIQELELNGSDLHLYHFHLIFCNNDDIIKILFHYSA